MDGFGPRQRHELTVTFDAELDVVAMAGTPEVHVPAFRREIDADVECACRVGVVKAQAGRLGGADGGRGELPVDVNQIWIDRHCNYLGAAIRFREFARWKRRSRRGR